MSKHCRYTKIRDQIKSKAIAARISSLSVVRFSMKQLAVSFLSKVVSRTLKGLPIILNFKFHFFPHYMVFFTYIETTFPILTYHCKGFRRNYEMCEIETILSIWTLFDFGVKFKSEQCFFKQTI